MGKILNKFESLRLTIRKIILFSFIALFHSQAFLNIKINCRLNIFKVYLYHFFNDVIWYDIWLIPFSFSCKNIKYFTCLTLKLNDKLCQLRNNYY